MRDRREVERIPCAGWLEYRLQDAVAGQIMDISKLGIGFVGALPAGVGDTLELVLMNRNVVVQGSVRHIRLGHDERFRIGVKFAREEEDLASVLLEMAT
ncbi:MAG: hypothetical protein HY342_13425 [Candidatus Lambdaproteobacteria bacterium]|nr:hypothetical protein [Candidatus Lambdaproteobacteria bacterium]